MNGFEVLVEGSDGNASILAESAKDSDSVPSSLASLSQFNLNLPDGKTQHVRGRLPSNPDES